MRHLTAAWAKTAQDYMGGHQPPRDGAPLHDLLGSDQFPRDVYSTLRHYVHGGYAYDRESIRAVEQARGKPDQMVTIYRSAPPGVTHFDTGNWVAVSLDYARQHGEGRGGEVWVEPADPDNVQDDEGWIRNEDDWPVYKASVLARQVLNGGNDIIEWGYFGPRIPATKA